MRLLLPQTKPFWKWPSHTEAKMMDVKPKNSNVTTRKVKMRKLGTGLFIGLSMFRNSRSTSESKHGAKSWSYKLTSSRSGRQPVFVHIHRWRYSTPENELLLSLVQLYCTTSSDTKNTHIISSPTDNQCALSSHVVYFRLGLFGWSHIIIAEICSNSVNGAQIGNQPFKVSDETDR